MSYVYSRISFFNEKQIWDLSKKLEGKYDELDKFISSIENGDHLKLEAKFENIMHHKFCVIDLKKVIHGSYNWSIKASVGCSPRLHHFNVCFFGFDGVVGDYTLRIFL